MVLMAKRKKEPESPVEKMLQHPLRFDDRQLLEVLDRHAATVRQSRNAAILTLIEEGLRNRGLWPPQPKE